MSRLSASGPRWSSLLRGARAAALVALGLGALLGTAGKAQAAVLVSNLEQTAVLFIAILSSNDFAQGFETGSNTGNYTLASIDIDFSTSLPSAGDASKLTVTLWSGTSGDRPGSLLATLTNPSNLSTGGGGNVKTFTARAGTVLIADTMYFVHMSYAGGGSVTLDSTASTNQDTSSAAGWTLNDIGLWGARGSTGSWSARVPIKVRINGTVGTTAANTAPTGSNNTVTTQEGTPHVFASAEFGFDDADGSDALLRVTVVTVPGAGMLALEGTAVTANQVVPRTDIDDGHLTFTPAAGASGDSYASFTFRVSDGRDVSVDAYTMTIDVTPAPVACPAPDFEDRRKFWEGALTVHAGPLFNGFNSHGGTGALTPATFTIGRNVYTVSLVSTRSSATDRGDLLFGLTDPLTDPLTTAEVAALRLHVCAEGFDFSDAPIDFLGNHEWEADLDWSMETTRTLYLSLPANNAATGEPAITGTAQAGQELTADASPIMDTDGLPSSFTYKWFRVDSDGTSNEAEISGETDATYTLTAADAGKKIKVKVSFTDELSGEEERTSAAYPSSGTVTASANTTAPALTSVTVTSTPHKTTDTYGAREHIEFTMTFDVPVTVTGAPTFAFDLGGASTATWYAGSGTTTLRFSHAVSGGSSGDRDTNGISWAQNAIALNGGTIAGTDNAEAAILTHVAQSNLAGHKVDGRTTAVTPATVTVAVTSTPMSMAAGSTTADTYGLDETIVITVTASEAVEVVGDPEFEFSMNNPGGAANDVPATYDRTRSSPTTMAFAYTVQAGDRDSDGIWIGNHSRTFMLDVNDRIRTASQQIDIDRSHPEKGTYTGHKVDGSLTPPATAPPDPTPPTLVSATATTLTVEWTHPGEGGSPLTRDYVHYRVQGATDWTNWYAGETPVTRAVITNLEADTAYQVRVHSSNAIGNSQWAQSATAFSTLANTPATGAPSITGTATVGQDLTATTGTIADADGLPSSFTYQWVRVDDDGTNPVDITDANAETYTLTDDDAGKKIKVKVSFTDDLDSTETRTSAAYPSSGTVTGTNIAPTSGEPIVDASEDTDYTFTADDFGFVDRNAGDSLASVKIVTLPASGTGTLTLSGTAIGSGDLPKTVTAAEIDDLKYSPPANLYGLAFASFTFKVNDGTVDSDNAYTMTIDVKGADDPATGEPEITGTAAVGQQLAVDLTGIEDADGLTNVSYSYQWVRVDADGLSNPADITDATDATYTVVYADLGKTLKVRVTFDDDDGNTETLTSAPTETVPGVTVSPTALTVTEEDTTGATYTVVLNSQPTLSVTVTVAGHAGTDVTPSPATLTFTTTNWGTAQTVTVTAGADADTANDTVTLTHSAASTDSEYEGITIAGVAVTVTDNDGNDTPPGVTVSKTALTVTEEDTTGATYTVVLNSQPTATVTVTVAGHAGTDVTPSPATLTFTPMTWGTAQTVTVTAGADADTANDTVTLTHSAASTDGDYQGITIADVAVTVTDNDDNDPPPPPPTNTPPVVAIPPVDQEATTGDLFTYVIPADAFTDADGNPLTYTAALSDGGRLPSWLTFDPATRTFTGTPGPGDGGTVRVTVMASDGTATVSDEFVLMVTVRNTAPVVANPLADQEVMIDVPFTYVVPADAFTDADGDPLTYTVTTSDDGGLPGWLTFDAATRTFTGTPASSDSGPVFVTVTASDGTATVSDEFALRVLMVAPSTLRAWTSRFGRTVATHVTDAVGERLRASPEQDSQVTVGGYRLPLGRQAAGGADPETTTDSETTKPETTTEPKTATDRLASLLTGLVGQALGLGPVHPQGGGPGTDPWAAPPAADPRLGQSQTLHLPTVRLRDVLLGSSFRLNLGDDAAAPGHLRLTAWGRVAGTQFSGRDGDLTLDGNVLTGTVGVDSAWDRWLAGVAVSHSLGGGSFTGDGDGDLDSSTLTSIHPYLRYAVNERVDVWSVLGYGWGDMTLEPGTGGTLETDTTLLMGSFGGRGILLSAPDNAGFQLATRMDAMLTRTTSGAVAGLAETEADAHRLRLVLEGTRPVLWPEGQSVTPTVELGVRHDWGDAETGFGLELGGRVQYADPNLGLTIEAAVRGLLTHEDSDYKEWGASGTIRIAPDPNGQGLSLTLAPTWGAASSGIESLWSRQTTAGLAPQGTRQSPTARLNAEIGYGLPAPLGPGLLTPYAGTVLTDGQARTYRLGTRWTSVSGLTLNVEGTRQDQAGQQPPTQGLQFQATWGF